MIAWSASSIIVKHCEPNPQFQNSGASRWMNGTSLEDTMAERLFVKVEWLLHCQINPPQLIYLFDADVDRLAHFEDVGWAADMVA